MALEAPARWRARASAVYVFPVPGGPWKISWGGGAEEFDAVLEPGRVGQVERFGQFGGGVGQGGRARGQRGGARHVADQGEDGLCVFGGLQDLGVRVLDHTRQSGGQVLEEVQGLVQVAPFDGTLQPLRTVGGRAVDHSDVRLEAVGGQHDVALAHAVEEGVEFPGDGLPARGSGGGEGGFHGPADTVQVPGRRGRGREARVEGDLRVVAPRSPDEGHAGGGVHAPDDPELAGSILVGRRVVEWLLGGHQRLPDGHSPVG
ncbi:hypothetical protein [Streptomyces sp. NPDC087787]|uniref:hypothetical protein n=1 Tax=Streptomyces sp. NPDC087787 TaxID=3365803 RepID=UPI00382C0F9F